MNERSEHKEEMTEEKMEAFLAEIRESILKTWRKDNLYPSVICIVHGETGSHVLAKASVFDMFMVLGNLSKSIANSTSNESVLRFLKKISESLTEQSEQSLEQAEFPDPNQMGLELT